MLCFQETPKKNYIRTPQYHSGGHSDRVHWNCIKIAGKKTPKAKYLCAHTCTTSVFCYFVICTTEKCGRVLLHYYSKGFAGDAQDASIYSETKSKECVCLYDNHFQHFSFPYTNIEDGFRMGCILYSVQCATHVVASNID